MKTHRRTLLFSLVLLVLTLVPHAASACSVCYGEPDSPAAHGLTWAIVALGAVVGVVLSAIVAFFVQANKAQNRMLAEEKSDNAG